MKLDPCALFAPRSSTHLHLRIRLIRADHTAQSQRDTLSDRRTGIYPSYTLLIMAKVQIQDRTTEFRSILAQASKRQNARVTSQRQSLLSEQEKATPKQRSEFSRKASEISRQVAATSAKLGRLAELAGRKTLFDDRSVEINELTFVIKQDLSALDSSIRALQASHPAPRPATSTSTPADQESEHARTVVLLLRQSLGGVTARFKDTLEQRTRAIRAARERSETFIGAVSAASTPASRNPSRTDSPLYAPPAAQQPRSRSPFFQTPGGAAAADILSLDPAGGSSGALARGAASASSAQLLMMEEGGSNSYVQARGEAIATIEATISELSGIFTQLAQLVAEQGEQITRIDDNVEDVVTNVEGAQRELLKYWSRVQGNRWLVAKMFGVLMVFFLLWVLIAG